MTYILAGFLIVTIAALTGVYIYANKYLKQANQDYIALLAWARARA